MDKRAKINPVNVWIMMQTIIIFNIFVLNTNKDMKNEQLVI